MDNETYYRLLREQNEGTLWKTISPDDPDYIPVDENDDDMLRLLTVSAGLLDEQLAKASLIKTPVALYDKLWYEGEVCCLFAPTNLGKSIFAVQIADHIANTLQRRVLYCDFELSDKQFQMRYTSDDGSSVHSFGPRFFRAGITSGNVPECIDHYIHDIRAQIKRYQTRIVVIDNLTWLCTEMENAQNAGYIMQRLLELKRDLGVSILIIAHTPKSAIGQTLTAASLAGSTSIINFMDSAFAIGRDFSVPDNSGRYVKQIKVRMGSFDYTADNVQLFTIDKQDDMLLFIPRGSGVEQNLLRHAETEGSDRQRRVLIDRAKELHASGKTQREIAEELGIGKGTVHRYLSA